MPKIKIDNIEYEFENVECILAGSNIGYGRANNIGLKKTTTKYAIILNPDTTLHPTAIENYINATKIITEFAIMGPYIQEEKNKEDKNYLNNLKPIQVFNVKGFAIQASPETMANNATRWLGHLWNYTGKGVRLPIRVLGSIDEFLKQVNYNSSSDTHI